ncbi:hypothetical protein P4679_24760 [Priestia megaterium]|uniref:hypothetical protein n=1 Tax=Priestia megaterium TaxID=1404 RepID=UPI002E1E2297|nr:hypothetical protein [Priestia megaterium]
MKKYGAIFIITIFICVALYGVFGFLFGNGGDIAEDAIKTFGLIIVVLLPFLIAQMFYVIDLLKKNNEKK